MCVRFDALGDDEKGTLGSDSKIFMEKRLKLLESGGTVIQAGGKGNAPKKYEATGDSKTYNDSNDFTGGANKRQRTE